MKFHHVRIDVTDLDRSLDFYVRVLGMTEVARYVSDERTTLHLGSDGAMPGIELWWEPLAGPVVINTSHLAFEVGDTDVAYADACAAGADGIVAPFSKGRDRIAFLRDPDGRPIELVSWTSL